MSYFSRLTDLSGIFGKYLSKFLKRSIKMTPDSKHLILIIIHPACLKSGGKVSEKISPMVMVIGHGHQVDNKYRNTFKSRNDHIVGFNEVTLSPTELFKS